MRALQLKICDTYIVSDADLAVEVWKPVSTDKFYLTLHKKTKRKNPYLILHANDEEVYVSEVFTVVNSEVPIIKKVLDITIGGSKTYYNVCQDTLENENITIRQK